MDFYLILMCVYVCLCVVCVCVCVSFLHQRQHEYCQWRNEALYWKHFTLVWETNETKSPWPHIGYVSITSYVTTKKCPQQTNNKFANLETFRPSCHCNCHRHQTVCEKKYDSLCYPYSVSGYPGVILILTDPCDSHLWITSFISLKSWPVKQNIHVCL
jgi:hypothetical protein